MIESAFRPGPGPPLAKIMTNRGKVGQLRKGWGHWYQKYWPRANERAEAGDLLGFRAGGRLAKWGLKFLPPRRA